MSSPGSLPSASAYNRERARSKENRARDTTATTNPSNNKRRGSGGGPTIATASSPTQTLPPLSSSSSPTLAANKGTTSDEFTPRHGRQNTEDPLMVDADADNPRGGRRVYQMTVSDLFECTTRVCTSVLQAVSASLGDGYLNHQAESATGVGGSSVPGRKVPSDNGGVDTADAYSMSGSTVRGSRRSRSQKYGKNDGRASSTNKYPVPVTSGDLVYLIRPPRNVNKYKTNSDMLRTIIPFGFIIPLVAVSIMLVIYNYAGVRICGMHSDCECDAGERALYFSTFGLFQDVPCALIFSCLVAAAVFQGKQCDETTKRRKDFNTPKAHRKNQVTDSSVSRQDFSNIDAAEGGGMSERDKAVSLTYGPYYLKSLSHYLKTREVVITAIFTAVLPIIARAVTLTIGMPDYLILPVTFVVKCIPLFVFATLKRNMMAAVPCAILIFVPISYQIFIRHIAEVQSVRQYVTGFWPLIIVVLDRVYLLLLKLTTHPSTCVGSLTIYTTLLAFTTQTLQLGLGVTIDGPENPAVISVYVLQFIIFEMFLNTVLLSRLGCYIVHQVTMWRYKRYEAAIAKKAESSTTVASSQKPPEEWKFDLRLTDISNIAALTRLPTLFISFLFMIPALHFPKWPQKTPAISCQGDTRYEATWVNYGLVIAVCLLIVIATLLMRRVEKRNMVLQFVFGQGWCILVAVYLFSIVVLSLGFLPTTLFFTEFAPTPGPSGPTTTTTTSAP